MKIAFLVNDITCIGGVERVICTLANRFVDELGYDVEIISIRESQGKEIVSKLNPKIKLNYLNFKVKQENKYVHMLREFLIIKKIIKSLKVDVLYSPYTITSIYLAILKNKFKGKIIAAQHGQYYMEEGRYNKLKRHFYKSLDMVILLTRRDEKIYEEFCIKTRVVENPSPFKREYLFNENNKKIIMLGRLSEEKSIEYGIEGFSRISKKFNDWTLEIIGDGPKKKELEQLIKKLNLEKKVFIRSFSTNVREVYKKAGVVLLTSQTEALPMVLIESQSFGIPSISFDIKTGPREIIIDGKTGLLVEKNNVIDLAKKLEFIIDNTEKRNKMSKNSYKASLRFSIDNIVIKWKEIFSEL